jgi:hypothetical protein
MRKVFPEFDPLWSPSFRTEIILCARIPRAISLLAFVLRYQSVEGENIYNHVAGEDGRNCGERGYRGKVAKASYQVQEFIMAFRVGIILKG